MADMIQFDLVSPERKLASYEASEIHVPGSEGDFTAMANHAPFLTTLRPGVLKVVTGSETHEYLVTGGFVEISGTSASVLAEEAVERKSADRAVVEAWIEAADAHAASKEGAEKDAADLRAHHTRSLLDAMLSGGGVAA